MIPTNEDYLKQDLECIFCGFCGSSFDTIIEKQSHMYSCVARTDFYNSSYEDQGAQIKSESSKDFITQPSTLSQELYLKRFKELLDELLTTTTKKNSDYADTKDAFANFRLIEILTNGNIKTVWGIFTRMTDKVKRIASLLFRSASVKDESLKDSLMDLAVYSLIMVIILEQNEK